MTREVIIDDCRLLLGNCLERMSEIVSGSVDMILCDLPYGTTSCSWDEVIPFQPLWAEYWRVLKPNGAIVLTAQTPFDKRLGASQIKFLRYEWIWEKTEATGHLNAKKAPMKAHENALVFYQQAPTYNPQKTFGHIRKTATKNRAKRQSEVYGAQTGVDNYDSTERYPRSVIVFPTDKQRGSLHPTQKPVALMEYFILTYTNEGETVLDNAMGSGTTGVACRRLGRKFIGIELVPSYFETATSRVTDARADLFAEAAA